MKIVVIAFAVLMMIAGGTVSVLKWMKLGPFADKGAAQAELVKAPAEPPVVIDMASLAIPVIQGDRVAAVVTIQLKLEAVGSDNATRIQKAMPRITDAFFRDLHAFIPRLLRQEEKLDIAVIKMRLRMVGDRVLAPGTIHDVLIESMTETAPSG